MEIFLGAILALYVIFNSGCASQQFIMKECKKVIDDAGADTGERVCKRG